MKVTISVPLCNRSRIIRVRDRNSPGEGHGRLVAPSAAGVEVGGAGRVGDGLGGAVVAFYRGLHPGVYSGI